jgi:hypothetical protein
MSEPYRIIFGYTDGTYTNSGKQNVCRKIN